MEFTQTSEEHQQQQQHDKQEGDEEKITDSQSQDTSVTEETAVDVEDALPATGDDLFLVGTEVWAGDPEYYGLGSVVDTLEEGLSQISPIAEGEAAEAEAEPSRETVVANLEKKIVRRPSLQDLVDRGVLKEDSMQVAPALHAAKVSLEKRRKSISLMEKLENRPEREELVQRHVLPDHNVAPALQVQVLTYFLFFLLFF